MSVDHECDVAVDGHGEDGEPDGDHRPGARLDRAEHPGTPGLPVDLDLQALLGVGRTLGLDQGRMASGGAKWSRVPSPPRTSRRGIVGLMASIGWSSILRLQRGLGGVPQPGLVNQPKASTSRVRSKSRLAGRVSVAARTPERTRRNRSVATDSPLGSYLC